jgi:hypothetical protein
MERRGIKRATEDEQTKANFLKKEKGPNIKDFCVLHLTGKVCSQGLAKMGHKMKPSQGSVKKKEKDLGQKNGPHLCSM